MIEKLEKKFTKYEIARILGARSLQLAMDAPILLKLSKEEEDELNYDTLKIAEKELLQGVLPITVKRPFPAKTKQTIKKLSEEELKKKIEENKKKAEEEKSRELLKEENDTKETIEKTHQEGDTEEFDEDSNQKEIE